MEEWKQYKLGDIANVQTGPFGSQLHNKDYVQEGTPIVTVEHLGSRDFTTQNLPKVSDDDKGRLSRYTLEEGDIVYSRVGSVDRCSYVSSKHIGWLFSGRCLRVRCDNRVNPLFLYYFLQQEEVKQAIRNIAVGATMPSINTKLLSEIAICVPSYNTQYQIASFLSSFDDKIEVNQRINDNLNQQAQSLYKSWFVDFEPFKDGEFIESELGMIPKGWKVVDAEEIFEINIGKTPPRKEHNWFTTNNKDEVWVSIADMGSCGVFISDSSEYLTAEAIKRFNIQMVEKDSVLLSFKLTVGRVAIASTRLTTNEAIARFILPRVYYREFLYLLLKQYKYENLGSTSSIATAVNSKTIKGMRLLVPSDSIIKSFSNLVKPLFDSIESSSKESRRLAQLRDTLLPRLMSGELNINTVNL